MSSITLPCGVIGAPYDAMSIDRSMIASSVFTGETFLEQAATPWRTAVGVFQFTRALFEGSVALCRRCLGPCRGTERSRQLEYCSQLLAGGEIHGQKWHDLDKDDTNNGEPPVPDWTVFVDTNNNGKFNQQTQQFFATASHLIPDGGNAVSDINVSNVSGLVAEVEVTLDIAHSAYRRRGCVSDQSQRYDGQTAQRPRQQWKCRSSPRILTTTPVYRLRPGCSPSMALSAPRRHLPASLAGLPMAPGN